MGKIRIRQIGKPEQQATDIADPDELPVGDVATAGLLAAANDPIHVRLHRMAPGSRIAWRDSSRGHLAFIWEGHVTVGEHRLGPGSMILVEHGAGSEAVAEDEAALLVFNASAASPDVPTRQGGHVHLLANDDVPRAARLSDSVDISAALYADADCATCELWLHGNDFHEADYAVAPHFHSEDEVIVVTGGEIVLGQRRYGRGTVIGIPRRTVYAFRSGPEGLSFINFRPGRPSYGLRGATETVDERTYYKAIPPPQYADGGVAIA